jgi:hypothetical protein
MAVGRKPQTVDGLCMIDENKISWIAKRKSPKVADECLRIARI